MTRATRDYLLFLALRERDQHAARLIDTGEEYSPEWGQAAAAVREVLETYETQETNMREKKLEEMLRKICDRSVPAGADSTGQEMIKLRLALIEQARELLDNANV